MEEKIKEPMMLTEFLVLNEKTGEKYSGFIMCRMEWDFICKEYVPSDTDIFEHLYSRHDKYNNILSSSLAVLKTEYAIINPSENLMLNMN